MKNQQPTTQWTPEAMMQLKIVSSVQISPDGQRVALAVRRAVMEAEKSEYLTHIYLTNTSGGGLRQLTTGDVSCTAPQWSPDGNWIAFISARSGKPNLWRIWVHGGEAERLDDVRAGVSSFKYSPDGRWIAFTALDPPTPEEEQAQKAKNDAWMVGQNIKRHHLYLIPTQAGADGEREVRRLTAGDYTVGISDFPGLYDWSPDGQLIAFAHAYSPGADDWTSANISLIDVESGAIQPLVQLDAPAIYGPFAALASHGYAILRANVRGSTGYGQAFRQANYRDWGGMDFQDLMAGVDHVVEMGLADPDRLGIVGWSYGGFLTALAITQTQRFGAAVVGAGITNLVSNAGAADIPSDIPNHFGGEPWQVADLLQERSPVLNVQNAVTPTLILHGELDRRVPISQGYELHTALKRRGCPVEMVVYPRTGHVPHEPKLLQDVMIRTLNWIDKHVGHSQTS